MASLKDIIRSYPGYELFTDANGKEKIHAYNTDWPLATPLQIELTAYQHNWQSNGFSHMKRAHDILWPNDKKTWHYWTERRFRAHCEGHHTIVLAGGANIGKSVDASKIALLYWLAGPKQRTILVASTTLTSLDNRIWGYVKRFYDKSSVPLPGKVNTSQAPKIIMNKMDTIHGMFAVAFKQGVSTADNLIGRHPDEGFLAIIDEGTDVAPNFMEAVANWEKAPKFQMIVVGNSSSRFDPHGLLAEPIGGWDSIDPDTTAEWETKDGICLYFDCYQSPAVHEKDPIKKKLLGKFLFTQEGIDRDRTRYGENSPEFWRFTRGFWPPEDVTPTILNPIMISKFKAKEAPMWSGIGKQYRLAGLDPAFTEKGDNCVLRFADLGQDINGKWILDYGGKDYIHYLTIDTSLDEPMMYQILNQTINICTKLQVPPENLALDIGGAGTGLADIFEKSWSTYIYKVSSAGPPSDTWVDSLRTIKAGKIYDRRVTEMWFSMQKFVQSDQIRGLDDQSCLQYCTRQYEWKGKKYRIETKEEYKLRLGKVDKKYVSPDEADAACLIMDLARQFFNFLPYADISYNKPSTIQERYFGNEPQQLSYHPRESTTERDTHNPMLWTDGFRHAEEDF